jgi:hypothetical protein
MSCPVGKVCASKPQLPTKPKVEIKGAAPAKEENTMLVGVIDLIASETRLDRSELSDDTLFVSTGVDH